MTGKREEMFLKAISSEGIAPVVFLHASEKSAQTSYRAFLDMLHGLKVPRIMVKNNKLKRKVNFDDRDYIFMHSDEDLKGTFHGSLHYTGDYHAYT